MDRQLAQLAARAQSAANANAAPYAVFNLNRNGPRMLVVRPAGNITAADTVAAGPFHPAE
jgi:hypothetical protein